MYNKDRHYHSIKQEEAVAGELRRSEEAQEEEHLAGLLHYLLLLENRLLGILAAHSTARIELAVELATL